MCVDHLPDEHLAIGGTHGGAFLDSNALIWPLTSARRKERRQVSRAIAGGAYTGRSSGDIGEPVGGRAKRAMDIVISATALLLLSPLMVIVAILVGVSMGSPIIFAQRRVGYGRSTFVCYKFRTMVVDADRVLREHLVRDPDAAREWRESRKLQHDPRVGCLGHILRKSSLDELPQLFNVLRGDMSCVGPRPVVDDEVANYGVYARECFKAKPGLTGIWQVNGRSLCQYSRRIALDRAYVRRWSVWLDLMILIKTVPAILKFDEAA
jgi:exopolysaccharide production protein ExoY